MLTASIPFAIDTNEFQLRLIGPGLIWIMAILSYMLTLNQLYENDGTFENPVKGLNQVGNRRTASILFTSQ